MSKELTVAEAAAAYGLAVANLDHPIILEQEGHPMAVILSFEEYQRLRSLMEDDLQRRRRGWASLGALVEEVHSRPAELPAAEIEAEIGAAREEVRRQRAHRRSH